jgi:hypothetical protein
MDEQREPLYRVVGGSGTYANPHRLRSDLEHLLGRIYPTGNSTLGQIAQARKLEAGSKNASSTWNISGIFTAPATSCAWPCSRTGQ